MSSTPTPAPWTRRDFVKTAGLFGGAVAAGWPAGARAQSPEGLVRIWGAFALIS